MGQAAAGGVSPMKYVAIVTKPKILQQDRMLTDADASPIGDNLFLPFVRLAERLKSEGIELHTVDMLPVEKFDAFYFFDMPGKKTEKYFRYAKEHGKPTILHVWENHFIARGNARFDRYADFDAVLTYNDDAVRDFGCTKVNYGIAFPSDVPEGLPFADRRFAVMISAPMKRHIPGNVSYLRLRTLDFYAKSHPNQIDLYGRGWDRGVYRFQARPEIFRFTHAMFLDKLLPRVRYPFWKGPCARKRDVLGNYRFVYCYENTDKIPGYITEKIFDVLMAGAVPVYLNHPSADRYIPRDTYIDRKDFASDELLYDCLSSMSEARWSEYRKSGISFLSEQVNGPFSIERFYVAVSKVIRKILTLGGKDE